MIIKKTCTKYNNTIFNQKYSINQSILIDIQWKTFSICMKQRKTNENIIHKKRKSVSQRNKHHENISQHVEN